MKKWEEIYETTIKVLALASLLITAIYQYETSTGFFKPRYVGTDCYPSAGMTVDCD